MSSTLAPFGLRRVRTVGSRPNSMGIGEYRIASLTTATLYSGQPVAINAAGFVDVLTSAGITTGPTVGVLEGVSYTDPVSKRPVWSGYWPGGTSATDAVAAVDDDPYATFWVQANTSLIAVNVGQLAGLTTASYTSGTTNYGTSYAVLNQSSLGTSNGLMRILRLATLPGNAINDAYTIVEVMFANHQFNTTAGI